MVDLEKFFADVRNSPDLALKTLEDNPNLVNAEWVEDGDFIKGSTALHWAAHYGYLELVKRLIELKANVNADCADWWCRPIDWAADSACYEVVELLINSGADISGDKWSKATPLHVVAQGGSSNGKSNTENYKRTAETLIRFGADVNAVANYGGSPPSITPLDDAIQVGNEAVVEVLRSNGGLKYQEINK